MSVSIGPLRFNGDEDAETFRDWVMSREGEDVRELEDSDVQAHFDAYCKEGLALLEAYDR
jgi:hypothetical protein